MSDTAIPQLISGSFLSYAKMLWEFIYQARFANLGATATIIPLVDPSIARINATTFATKVSSASGSAQTATWTAAPSALATPVVLNAIAGTSVWTAPGLYGPTGIPGIILNGTSEYLTIPDVNYWTNIASAFSIIFWGVITNQAATQYILTKYGAAGAREWGFGITSAEKPFLLLNDDSAGVDIDRTADAAVTTAIPVQIVVTKGAGNGATAMNDALVYVNGAVVASTATNSGAFVDMENLASAVYLGALGTPGLYYNGLVFGGPLGVTFVQAQITAAQAKNDYDIGRAALGLG